MKERSNNIALPVLKLDSDRRAGTKMGLRRAVALVVVHLLVAAHVWFFLKYGSTFTPLEPSEAGHSISTGAINAGAIFFAILILSTLIFGRFFCGWACHVVAYQDAARWLLIKMGLRPRPVRARLLMLVPLFAVFWLYGRPLLSRFTSSEHGNNAGISLALTTNDFWATFPGPVITILTFLVCGFVIIYFLGAKGFCTYGCPYGAIFGISDRFAPGRIRVNEDCERTGNCTRTCSSNVDVAGEVARYGMVVDPGCMKCMDCIAGCPTDALHFGFGSLPGKAKKTARLRNKTQELTEETLTPTLSQRERERKKVDRHYDFSWTEEIAAALAFALLFFIVYNLYRVVPLLMAIGVCLVLVAILLPAARLLYRRDVPLQSWSLKRAGRLTAAGISYCLLAILVVAGVAHSAVVQFHTRAGLAAYQDAEAARLAGEEINFSQSKAVALDHLTTARNWGFFNIRSVPAMLGEIARWQGDPQTAAQLLQQEIDAGSRSDDVVMLLGIAQLELQQVDDARQSIDSAFADRLPPRDRFARLDWELSRLVRAQTDPQFIQTITKLRIEKLQQAIQIYPDFETAAVNLCQILARNPNASIRDPAEALRIAEQVSGAANGNNPTLLAMLAALQYMHDKPADAAVTAQRAEQRATELGDKSLAEDMRRAADLYRDEAAAAQSRPSSEQAP